MDNGCKGHGLAVVEANVIDAWTYLEGSMRITMWRAVMVVRMPFSMGC